MLAINCHVMCYGVNAFIPYINYSTNIYSLYIFIKFIYKKKLFGKLIIKI